MASEGRASDKWPTGAGAASGGHVAPEFTSDESFLDALKPDDSGGDLDFTRRARRAQAAGASAPPTSPPRLRHPTPEETATARRERDLEGAAPARTRVVPRSDDPGQVRRSQVTSRPRSAVRRVKRTVKHVDPLSVLRLSLLCYAVMLVVWLVFVAFVYWILASMGLFDSLEKIGRAFTLWENVNITLWLVERWAFLIGLTFVVVASLANLAISALYNFGADVVGGVEMTFVEKDA